MADQLTSQQFAAKIRAKYPGAYDNVADDELTQRVVAKYPDYAPMVSMNQSNMQMTPESLGVKPGVPGAPAPHSVSNLEGVAAKGNVYLPSKQLSMPGSFEGKPENTGQYIPNGPGEMAAGVKDIATGNFSKGAHRVISGAGTTSLPVVALTGLTPAALPTTARVLAGGAAGAVVGQKGAEALGATPDQAELAGDIGAVLGGGAAQGVRNVLRPTAKMGERVINTLSKTAEQEGFQFAPKDVPSAFKSLSDQFIARGKQGYQAIDKAVEGELQPVLDKIEDLEFAIKVQKNVDPEKAKALEAQLAETMQRKADTLAKAKANGMDDAEQVLFQADKDYSRGKSLEAMTKKVKTASGVAREGGKTNVSKFTTIVDNAKNQEKLTKALGEDSLSALQGHARSALLNRKAIKVAAGLAGTAGIGGAALYGAKHVLTSDSKK